MNQSSDAQEGTVFEMPSPAAQTARAERVVKLILDMDSWIRALRKIVVPGKPWQRTLIAHLDQADRDMQILRMSMVMDKPDSAIIESIDALANTCRRMNLALHGTRADATVRKSAYGIASASDTLRGLARETVDIHRP